MKMSLKLLKLCCILLITISCCVSSSTIVEDPSAAEATEVSTEFEVTIGGKLRSCRIEHCALICEGDEAILNVCSIFPQISSSNSASCTVKNKCELQCNSQLIGDICSHTTPSSSSSTTTTHLRRSLGNIGVHNNPDVKLWPDAHVCYKIDDDVDSTKVIGAMNHWKEMTGVQFTTCKVTADSCCAPCGEYIRFIKGTGCWSFVGRQDGLCEKGGQMLSAASTCTQGNIIHEIGHAIGLLHEHARLDRDQYVRIDMGNVKPEFYHNFDVGGVSDVTMNGEYDYYSVMHYGTHSFAQDSSKPTLTPIDSNGNIRSDLINILGQRESLSAADVRTIAAMYDLAVKPESQIVATTDAPVDFGSSASSQEQFYIDLQRYMIYGLIATFTFIFLWCMCSLCCHSSPSVRARKDLGDDMLCTPAGSPKAPRIVRGPATVNPGYNLQNHSVGHLVLTPTKPYSKV